MEKAPVFISWSGTASKAVAEALREWLPDFFQSVDPFMSGEDIVAGDLWFDRIGRALRDSQFCIICVTPENLSSSWLHFEAGAIGMARAAESTGAPASVVPYLLGLDTADLEPPLSLYQAAAASRAGTHGLLRSLNRMLPMSLTGESLDRSFALWWPSLEVKLELARNGLGVTEPSAVERTERDMLEELLKLMRSNLRETTRQRKFEQHEPVLTSILAQQQVAHLTAALGIDVQVTEESPGVLLVTVPYNKSLTSRQRHAIADTLSSIKGVRAVKFHEEEPF